MLATISRFSVVMLHLLLRHGHEKVLVEALGQLLEHLVLVPPHQDRLQRLADLVEILVADDLAVVVAHLMIVQQAEGRTQPEAIDELHDGDQFLEPVFQRRAGEHDGVGRGDLLDAAGGAGVPVLDALGLVENDQVRRPVLRSGRDRDGPCRSW